MQPMRQRAVLAGLVVALATLGACAAPSLPLQRSPPLPPSASTGEPSAALGVPPPPPGPTRALPRVSETGLASWYTHGHRLHRTANGEHFSGKDLTAAHRTLPMHTIVRVTNLRNGRTVRVRINDRGPFHRSRVIDVSHSAALALGMRDAGLARVRVEVFDEDQITTTADAD